MSLTARIAQHVTGLTEFRAWIAAVALGTVLFLESLRLFVGYLVFVVDQSQRFWLGATVLFVFLLPLLAIGLVRLRGSGTAIRDAAGLLVLARLIAQFWEQPVARVVLGAAGVVAWSWFIIGVIASRRFAAAAGFILGLVLDLAIRMALTGNDLPWSPGVGAHLTLVILSLLTIALILTLPLPARPAEQRLPSALVFGGIGPVLALYILVTGNPGFAQVKTDLDLPFAGFILLIGFVLGLAIGIVRTIALTATGGSAMIAMRFVIFDLLIGGVALWMLWGEGDLRILGLLFAVATSVELMLFSLISPGRDGRDSVRNSALAVTLGLLLLMAILFPYYSATGSGLMLALAWVLLGAAAILNVLQTSALNDWRRWNTGDLVRPAAAALLLLFLAVGWQLVRGASEHDTEVLRGDLTVMAYNIQSGFSRDNVWDLEAIAKVIEGEDPDIVLLQEVSRGWLVTGSNDQLIWLADRLEMDVVWGPASTDDLWGNAILTRGTVNSDFLIRYDSTQNLRRSAVGALIEYELGLFTSVATHLDNPSTAGREREGQLDQLLGVW
ncbi:MAG: endonuclease/exonuclease/phosphatase family protein, partial [Chloroflexota bacterium]